MSTAITIAIGVVFVFLTFSLVISGVNEALRTDRAQLALNEECNQLLEGVWADERDVAPASGSSRIFPSGR